VKLFLLGATRPGQWKCDVADAGRALGWQVTHQLDRDVSCDQVVRLAAGHDLFLWARTHGKQPSGNLTIMIDRLRGLSIPTAGLHLDLYHGLTHRDSRVGRDPWWSLDYVFTADGGHQKWFRDRGVNHFWCPPAMGLARLGRGQVVPELSSRVAFTGRLTVFHGRHRRDLLVWAKRTFGKGFVQYVPPNNGVYGARLNDLCASAWVMIGDSAPSDYYWSDRIPTTMGRGGMLAHPRTPGLEEQGFTKENMILYDRFDFQELARQVSDLTEQDRKDRTEAALALIADRHLWTHRLVHIADTVLGKH
jgi:hypothetical protein